MKHPSCRSMNILVREAKTKLGDHQFNYRSCGQYVNDRTGTSFNFIHYPADIVMLVIHHYTRYKLSLVDVTELMMIRGFSLSHETVKLWVQSFGKEISVKIRKNRWQNVSRKWHMDVCYANS